MKIEDKRAKARQRAVDETVSAVRSIERSLGVTREGTNAIKEELIKLAHKGDLFPIEDFPPPNRTDLRPNVLYLISEDPDKRFALYVTASQRRYLTAPHNHQTWAVIVGIQGGEPNIFYKKTEDGGVEITGRDTVSLGKGVAFMPEDIHALDIPGVEPVINFHMYGLGLPYLDKRQYYNERDNTWHYFPAITNIQDARASNRAS